MNSADLDAHDLALVTATLPILLPAEADVGLIEIEQAIVGDSDAMSVARQIGQELLGTGEGLFGIDDPFGCAQWRKSGGKCLRLVEMRRDRQRIAVHRLWNAAVRPSRNRRRNRRESTRTGRKNPGLQAIQRLPSDEMPPPGTTQCSMRVVLEVLTPCVQDGDDADVGTEVLAIGGNGDQRVGRSLKQQSVDLGLVLVGHRADYGRQHEDEMKIRHRLEARLRAPPAMPPQLATDIWTVPIAARIIGDAGVRTVLAALDMTAERGSAANLDRRHDASLGEVHVTGVGCAPSLTMAPEDFRHLELRPDHVGLASGRRCRFNNQEFK